MLETLPSPLTIYSERQREALQATCGRLHFSSREEQA